MLGLRCFLRRCIFWRSLEVVRCAQPTESRSAVQAMIRRLPLAVVVVAVSRVDLLHGAKVNL
jgi:hypothetical protein